jgi:hypothetical protein
MKIFLRIFQEEIFFEVHFKITHFCSGFDGGAIDLFFALSVCFQIFQE